VSNIRVTPKLQHVGVDIIEACSVYELCGGLLNKPGKSLEQHAVEEVGTLLCPLMLYMRQT
jgi:hypothetical protein